MTRSVDVRVSHVVNFALLLTMGGAWGLHFVLIKILSAAGVNLDLALLPTLGGVALVFAGAAGLARSEWRIRRSWLVFLLMCSLLGYAFPIWLELFVSPHIDATLLTLVVTSTPVLTIVVAFVSRMGTVRLNEGFAALLGVAATLMLLLPDTALPDSSSRLFVLLALGVPASYAVYNMYVARFWPEGLGLFTMAAWESLAASLIALPLFLRSVSASELATLGTHWQPLFALVGVTAIEVWAFFEIVRRAGGVYVSFASFAALAGGIAWSALLLSETITLWMMVSMGLIVVSLLFCAMNRGIPETAGERAGE